MLTIREPHGVTGHIMPWNYPMQIFGRSVGGALAAGNACVVKPAEDACLSMLRIAELAADLPAAPARSTSSPATATRPATRSRAIRTSTTSRSPARRRSARVVVRAAAEHHTPVTLELGGKSPQIVFADADLDAALPGDRQRHRAERRADLLGRQPRCSSSAPSTTACSTCSARSFESLRVGPPRCATSTAAR